MKTNVLIADDDASIRFVVSKSLSRAGYNVKATDNAETLMKWIKAGQGDVVLSDVHMGQDDIFNFIPELKQARPELPVIIMSANTSVMTALKSGKFGVFEYIPKPFDLTLLQDTIERAAGLGAPKTRAPAAVQADAHGPMIGKSVAMQPVYRGISDFTSGDIPVYIFGDVGTGKSLTAQLIHSSGKRKSKPFLNFNDVQEIEDIMTKTEAGDLFVDRAFELSAEQQRLLLRALEENERQSAENKFRLISTGTDSFQKMQSSGVLRPELLTHIRGGQVFVPPLLDRTEDIADLAIYFLNADPALKRKRKFSKPALNLIVNQDWYGNVRDLKRFVQSVSLQYADTLISDRIVETVLRNQFTTDESKEMEYLRRDSINSAVRKLLREIESDGGETAYNTAISWVEKPLIEEALKVTKGNNVKAAKLLGIHRNTLRMKIKSLGIIN